MPAHIPLSVCGHINAWNFLGAVRILGVTTSTEFPCLRLAGPKLPGPDFVLLGRLMAARARDVDMMGKRFGACNVGVASVTLLRGFRWPGVVRIVACDTGLKWVVRCRDDLRKPRGSRRKEFMTQRTVTPFARGRQLDRDGVLGMRRRGTVTDLAGNALMVSIALGLHNVRMTIGARHLAGILDWLRNDVIDRRSAVVTVSSEIMRDQKMPGDEQCGQQDHQKDRQSLDLLRNPVPERWVGCYRRGTVMVLMGRFIHNV